MSYLQVAGFLDHSTVNGPGLRATLFLSGCVHNCPGCHNKDMQDFAYGDWVSISEIAKRIEKNLPLIDGLTLSGGDPFEQVSPLIELLELIKPFNLNIWAYTGYLYETLLKDPIRKTLLQYIHTLVDGPYVSARHTETLKYVGSDNQRILHLHP